MPPENPVPSQDTLVQTLTLPITAATIRYTTGNNQKQLVLTFTGGTVVRVPCI